VNVGYARVSTGDQNLDLQLNALKAAGCEAERIFTDRLNGGKDDRPGLTQALGYVREGDTLVVWRLDRLGRSLSHLIQVTTKLEQRGVGFKSLQEGIDTTTRGGKLVFHIFGAPDVSVQQVADHFGVARSTLYRLLDKAASGKATQDAA